LTALQAPPGPADKLSLSGDAPSAFQATEPEADQFPYVSIGGIALQHQNLGHQPVALQDLSGTSNFFNPTGAIPPTGGTLQSFANLTQPLNWGIRGTAGYYWNGQSIEASGFGILQQTKTVAVTTTNGVYALFTNPPALFDTTNGMFLEADLISTYFRTSLASAELNYRYKSEAFFTTELILGVRYVNQQETLGVTTINDPGNPLAQATYTVHTQNNVIAPQIGLEWSHIFANLFTLGFTAKAALGADVTNVQTELLRGDGYIGFSNSRGATELAGVWEFGPFFDLNLTEKFHIRAGYNAIWMTGMTLAVDQFDLNLSQPGGRVSHDGSVFYHGPTFELQFAF
jgi:hypothetical protein